MFQSAPFKVLQNAKVKGLKNYESNEEAIRGVLGSNFSNI